MTAPDPLRACPFCDGLIVAAMDDLFGEGYRANHTTSCLAAVLLDVADDGWSNTLWRIGPECP